METIQLLALALGLPTLSGLNLYLTVALAGLAVRFDWLSLAAKYEQLQVLGDPWIIGIASAMFLCEFFADKIPGLDTTWDAVHTFIRPIGGGLLALTALGEMNPAIGVIGGLLGGGLALTTHAGKASTRLASNLIPEPITNVGSSIGLSLAEDFSVVVGFILLILMPVVALILLSLLLLAAFFIIRKTHHQFRRKSTPMPPSAA